MKILLISDQMINSDHSAVEGLFYKALNKKITADIVYIDQNANEAYQLESHKIAISKKAKRVGIINELQFLVDLTSYDYVIVRNYFQVLKQLLPYCKKQSIKIGFWESFPHNYRRFEEAKLTNKSVLRKSLEWFLKYRMQKKLISQCDFYLPISKKLKDDFYADINMRSYPLSLGVDMEIMPHTDQKKLSENTDTKKFIYIGTIDQLRDFHLILNAFMQVEENYQLFIYTPSNNSYTDDLKKLSSHNAKICWCKPLKRQALFKELLKADIAVGIFPETKTYRSASPTKTIEYYALGLPALLNHIPEYDLLFNEKSAIFCDFNESSIKDAIKKAIDMPKEQLLAMGNQGRKLILEKRAYDQMVAPLLDFLRSV
ncbi:glycosyltransferase [Thiotrichales bacterium 19S9-12]|nr:glycosyltransferase [Thiotrichales bacterium 19S9-11]MCF6811754.1 glycosyltransferase [Thiotrichales bacterium 19S9-12]